MFSRDIPTYFKESRRLGPCRQNWFSTGDYREGNDHFLVIDDDEAFALFSEPSYSHCVCARSNCARKERWSSLKTRLNLLREGK